MHDPDEERARAGQSSIDAIIELYKKDVDRTLLREALRLTPDRSPAGSQGRWGDEAVE